MSGSYLLYCMNNSFARWMMLALTTLVSSVVRRIAFEPVAGGYDACFRPIREETLFCENDKLTSSLQVGHRSEIVFLVESVFA